MKSKFRVYPAGSYLADEQDDEQDQAPGRRKRKDQLGLSSIVSNFAAAKLTNVIAVVAQACLEPIYSVNRIGRG